MKYHFANSRDPLKEGSSIKAICGVKVPKATFAAMAEMVDWGHVEWKVNC